MAGWVSVDEGVSTYASLLVHARRACSPNGSGAHMHACLGMCRMSLVSFVFGQRALIQRQYFSSKKHARVGSEHDLQQELRLPVKVTHRVKIEVMVVCTNT